jgi:DNA modification methylase
VIESLMLQEHQDGEADAEPQVDRAAELAEKWGVKAGDLWLIGEHRLLCGDSRKAEDVGRVMGGASCDMFLTDPPYCSGGFQEAGRASGSIGTTRIGQDGKAYTPRIHNDALSSRGYCALMKSVLGAWKPSFAYMFTDWRMWVQLFDVMESSGFGVRNMIVWDKGAPAMGRGWRSQHELVMFGAAAKPEFDKHKAVGNVLKSKRTGNPDHPTQKPVDIMEAILGITDFCQNIGDPFLGSGTTMVAAQNLKRKCYGIEISPGYVGVILQRMADSFPGIEIRKSDA